MRLTHRLLIAASPWIGGAWVVVRQRRYRRIGRALGPAESAALAPYFEHRVLDRVRVAEVARIDPPPFASLARSCGAGSLVDLSTVRAMAFGDSVVVAGGRAPSLPLLFHELVHVVQYEVLGIRVMLRRYVTDWALSNGDVLEIAAERCAYDLQERFESRPGEPFSVTTEVRRSMRPGALG